MNQPAVKDAPRSPPHTESRGRSPQASLGLLDATMVGMGAMIGAGIFVLTGLDAGEHYIIAAEAEVEEVMNLLQG